MDLATVQETVHDYWLDIIFPDLISKQNLRRHCFHNFKSLPGASELRCVLREFVLGNVSYRKHRHLYGTVANGNMGMDLPQTLLSKVGGVGVSVTI